MGCHYDCASRLGKNILCLNEKVLISGNMRHRRGEKREECTYSSEDQCNTSVPWTKAKNTASSLLGKNPFCLLTSSLMLLLLLLLLLPL